MELAKMDGSVLNHVVNNIFLPMQLPQVEDHSGAQGGTFVRLVASVLPLLEIEGLEETKAMMESWGIVQQSFVGWKAVLRNIEPGKTCAVFLRSQNAGLTVSIPAHDEGSATLAVFRVAAASSEVMGAPGDLSGIFPGWSVTTFADRVRNDSFARQVADLANNVVEEMVPKSRKAGSLHSEERDVVDSRCVTEWLLGAVAGHSVITGSNGVKRVRKKIRDDVLWEKGSRLPWRRSGEYMAVKVVLHSRLMGGDLGETDGLLAYKLIMLNVMSVCLQTCFSRMDSDVILQMLSKIARRISKLKELENRCPVRNSSLRRCIQHRWKEICEVVIHVRGKLDERWLSIMKEEAKQPAVNVDRGKLDFKADLVHSFQTASPYIQVALSPPSPPCNPDQYSLWCFQRNVSLGWPDAELLGCTDSYVAAICLHDIEVWVRDVLFLELQEDTDRPETKLFKLLKKYTDRATVFYKNDCLGLSRMLLTAISIVAVLDRLAGREFPLLQEYDAGVDVGVFKFLLLPHRQDMEHLTKLEAYFGRRLEKRALPMSLISEDVPSKLSFVVRQGQRDPEVKKRKEQILDFARQEKLKKLVELSKARERRNNLTRLASRMSCDEEINSVGSSYHPASCGKCKKKREAAAIRVNVFEFPLPTKVHLQDAVVGELVASTSSWTTLRDALHVLHRDVLNVELQGCENRGSWRCYEPLIPWVCFPTEHPLITLGSTSKLILKSHYAGGSDIDCPDEHFFKPCGFNVRLIEHCVAHLASTSTYKETPDVRLLATLDTDGDYKCLQWTMGGTSHTENEVLCKQADCPQELDLVEYIAFGTLRAGQRIQIRNLVRVLEMQTLSLSQPSVVNLIAQALWETGPPNEAWCRESHLDLRDENFARYALQRMQFITQNASGNWKDHLTLLSVVNVGARVLALSKPSWDMAAMNVLRNCRRLADTWLKQIEEVLGGMIASPIHETQRMRSKLVDVAAIAALTFDVDDRHLESLAMQGNSDVIYWLRAIARIHDNVLLNSESEVSKFQGNLLRRVQLTSLRLETALQRHLDQHGDSLDGFVRRHWADAYQGHTEGPWECYESPGEHWWTTTFMHGTSDGHVSTLHVDTLRGSFLVNGLPVGRLPSEITGHEDYARVFGCHVFEVQPAAASRSTFVSRCELKGSVFTFALEGTRLVVKDRRGNQEFELFPSRFFGGDLPNLLINGYSHWMTTTELPKRILFRSVRFDDDHFADGGVPFEIDLNSKCVQESHRDRKLVDIRSASFKEVYDGVLHRLELPSHVHMFVNSDSGDIHVELPRMGLSFHVKEGVLWSREQPGFYISDYQSLGTLVGLRQGVVLIEERPPEMGIAPKRCLLMPHVQNLSSQMKRRPGSTQSHPVVVIQDFRFSSPSVFVYDVDDRLRCLRAPASQAAWLYLALLHGLTAHPLPDPFTGLTGAESAMRLLQSPRCWSCKPFDAVSVSILHAIATLAPRRQWYPQHLQCMQTVSWPKGLFPSTALDAFRIVVEKLIGESNRLRVLFPCSEGKPLPPEPSNLRRKSYWRSRNFLGQEALMSSKAEGFHPDVRFTSINLSNEEGKHLQELSGMLTLAEIGFQWGAILFSFWPILGSSGNHLVSTLLNRASLRGATHEDILPVQSTVSIWQKLADGGDFADNWINLYRVARKVNVSGRRQEFTFLLAFLAFRGVDYQLIILLLYVAVHANIFEGIDPPTYESYEFTNQVSFDSTMVRAEISGHAVPFSIPYRGKNPLSRKKLDDELRETYRKNLAEDVERLVGIAERSWRVWPDATMSFRSSRSIRDSSKALHGVRKLFERWHRNKQLYNFVSSVKGKVTLPSHRTAVALQPAPLQTPKDNNASSRHGFTYELPISPSKLLPLQYSEAEAIFQSGQFGRSFHVDCMEVEQNARVLDAHPSFLKSDPSSSACQVSEVFKVDLRHSWDQRHELQSRPLSTNSPRKQVAAKLLECKMKSSSLWMDIHNVLMPSGEDWTSRALEAAGLWRRVIPVALLPLILSPAEDRWRCVRMTLGALAVIWTLEQQAERCLRFFDTNEAALQKELENTSARNWKPMDRPEWLLLELEGDYRMRKVQVDVTKAMLEPLDNQNAVLQLNMGEGKTSVIVPALCASISDGQQFARLTVLSSLFRVNFDALASKLGGLVNRRVYTFPCCRDMKLSVDEVARMKSAYLNCIGERGVVVTRPEHRLSAQLMSLEHCRSGRGELRELLEFVNRKAGDVLDESDLILQVKYQVIYTIGEQKNIGGGNLRWKLSQSVLHSARRHFGFLAKEFGSDAIEFNETDEGLSAFPHIRLLNDGPKTSLYERILEDILGGSLEVLAIRELQGHQKDLIRKFILDNNSVSLEEVQRVLPREGPLLHIVLILRGLLCYGVLMHALRLRWRVEYGVRPSGRPKMAVPFRAKDVPVERAEFGHPDVAIMLTQLSYYNSGLSDEQLLEAFQRLYRLSSRDFEYKRWLKDVVAVGDLPATLSDVNLDDYVQRKQKLLPLLRRNMRVIDFWLSDSVFPVECKQFVEKLVASAWDLCCRESRPVCGFSGTRDTRLLLPTSISQRDLPELQGTDGVVIANLLRKENRMYRSLSSHVDGRGILKNVIGHEALVLLDVGALMVDLSNREVAITWLSMLSGKVGIEAAIYFDDKDNQIMAVGRDGHDAPLPLSPFHRKMDACVVYLDDVHTRGTDLKLPAGYHACVTLGRGITKDRLVQACMRMRMLGAGHSVSFWASHEVDSSIRLMCPGKVLTSEDVLDWVTRNSVQSIKDGFRHWGAQGITHCRRQTVNWLSSSGDMTVRALGELNTQKEVVDLDECYGKERRGTPLPCVISKWLHNAAANMQDGTGLRSPSGALIMMDLGLPIVKRIEEYASGVECCAEVLDEEQERELEHELEEEEEIQRPGAACPHFPHLSPDVAALASGRFNRGSGEFFPALHALQCCSSLWERAEVEAWSVMFYVTREFATVVSQDSPIRGADFLRPVTWVVVIPEAIVLLSSFEANELLPKFRLGGSSASLHMFAPRRREGQDLLLREEALVLPVARSIAKMDRIGLPLLAQLQAFSGNAFFASRKEESAFLEFLGLCPHPRLRFQEDAFHRGEIGLDGFVHPEKRHIVAPTLRSTCGFKRSPVGFMEDLLSARGWHGYPSSSHVGLILFVGKCASNLPD